MKTWLTVVFLSLCYSALHGAEHSASWSIYFSPHGGCSDAVVEQLSRAKSSVLVQAYSFTSAPIAKALVEAHHRHVKVEVVLDKSQRTEKYSSATYIYNNGIPCYIDAQHAIAHNKIIVIDGQTVLTGSFNFTKAAEENNAENLLVIHDRELAARYTQNWQEHRQHSDPYTGLPAHKEQLHFPKRLFSNAADRKAETPSLPVWFRLAQS